MLWIVEFETASLDDEAEVDVRAVFQDSLRHVDRFEFDRPNQSTLGTSIDRAISVAWALIRESWPLGECWAPKVRLNRIRSVVPR